MSFAPGSVGSSRFPSLQFLCLERVAGQASAWVWMGVHVAVAILMFWPVTSSASTPNECIGWGQGQPGNPPPSREAHSAIYDSARQQLVVFGGLLQSYAYFWKNDTWILPLDSPSEWSEVATTGPRPSERARHSAIHDPIRNRMIVFGGMDEYWNGVERVERYFDDVWALSLDGVPTWSRLAPTGLGPAVRAGHSAIYDPVRDRMVIVGGYRREPTGTGSGIYSRIVYEDTWTLSLTGEGSWQQLPIPTLPPYTGVFAAAGYDPVRDRIVLVNVAPEVWTLPLASSSGWIQTPVAGGRAGGRTARWVFGYDAAVDRMLFATDQLALSALSLDGDTLRWTAHQIYGPPQYRYEHYDAGIVYDPVRRRMIFALGNTSNETLAAEVFPDHFGLILTAIRPERGSVDRSPKKSCYSPGESVVITATPSGDHVFDDWDGDADGDENPMKIVMERNMVIQAEFDRPTAVLVSRFDANAGEGGIELRWGFADETRVQSVRIERAPAANGPWVDLPLETRIQDGITIALDPTTDGGNSWFYRLVVSLRDGSFATLGPVVSQPLELIRESAITSVSPNPSTGATRIQLAVARSGRVRLTLVDIAGRQVATLVDADHVAGRLTAAWDGAGDSGRIRPGTYFLRLSTADRNAVQRLVVVR